jgi:hypothetical protein
LLKGVLFKFITVVPARAASARRQQRTSYTDYMMRLT